MFGKRIFNLGASSLSHVDRLCFRPFPQRSSLDYSLFALVDYASVLSYAFNTPAVSPFCLFIPCRFACLYTLAYPAACLDVVWSLGISRFPLERGWFFWVCALCMPSSQLCMRHTPHGCRRPHGS
ncbi:hypothetical protein MPNT_80021 [Candidatus Methylacidithermus pantelleriae]|uniref:Uncharacterized protein n=1 Tax=Candidatus Methylacidithermus pantelleriae TaxID=2744239 RepID=A0A8J2BPQ2_9BACT|nr:hypothetical protein MPNT_80021 [Candidatus Methylacidithermus pantelleriae]